MKTFPSAAPRVGIAVLVAAALAAPLAALAQDRSPSGRSASSRDNGTPARRYGVATAPTKAPGAIRIATYNMLTWADRKVSREADVFERHPLQKRIWSSGAKTI